MLDIRSENQSLWTILHLNGELDIETMTILMKEVQAAIEEKCKGLVLNLKNVHYIDASAMSVLIDMQKRLMDRDIKIRMALVDEGVLEMIKLAHLENFFEMFASLKDAVL